MTQQGVVTINGFVGAEPVGFGREGGPPACSFRIGCTRSHFDMASKTWSDHPTTWITVKAFRALAANVRVSVHKGDPVMVTGLLDTEQWQRDGVERSRLVLEASGVGHDLSLGVSDFHRNKQRSAPNDAASGEHGGSAAQQAQEGEPVGMDPFAEAGHLMPESAAQPPDVVTAAAPATGWVGEGSGAASNVRVQASEFGGPEF